MNEIDRARKLVAAARRLAVPAPFGALWRGDALHLARVAPDGIELLRVQHGRVERRRLPHAPGVSRAGLRAHPLDDRRLLLFDHERIWSIELR